MRVKARWHTVQRKCLSAGFMVVHRGGMEIRGNKNEKRDWCGNKSGVNAWYWYFRRLREPMYIPVTIINTYGNVQLKITWM